jgi:hypothetical protein
MKTRSLDLVNDLTIMEDLSIFEGTALASTKNDTDAAGLSRLKTGRNRITRYDFGLMISEPFIQFKIKAATSYISKKIRKRTIRSFPLTGHHFWLLVRMQYGQELVLEAIHGLSTINRSDPNGDIRIYIASEGLKTWNSKLQVYCVLPPKAEFYRSIETPFIPWIEPHETYTQHYDTGFKRNVLKLWHQVKYSIKDLNEAKVPYSFCGLGKSLGVMSKNSNSAYASIAHIMGVKPHRFKGVLAPGCNTTMLARKVLESLRA